MADWRKVAKVALLGGDGHIDTREVQVLRSALLGDGEVSKSELEFLAELRAESTSRVKVFEELFADAVKMNVLANGVIDEKETEWLKKVIYQDEQVDAEELQLLRDLKIAAKSVCTEFGALYATLVKE